MARTVRNLYLRGKKVAYPGSAKFKVKRWLESDPDSAELIHVKSKGGYKLTRTALS